MSMLEAWQWLCELVTLGPWCLYYNSRVHELGMGSFKHTEIGAKHVHDAGVRALRLGASSQRRPWHEVGYPGKLIS